MATTPIYTLSLHDALPISQFPWRPATLSLSPTSRPCGRGKAVCVTRSEEHTSELQSRGHLVCRLLLEKKRESTTHRSEPTVKSVSAAAIRAGGVRRGAMLP